MEEGCIIRISTMNKLEKDLYMGKYRKAVG